MNKLYSTTMYTLVSELRGNMKCLLFWFSIIMMSAYSPEHLHTDRSIQLDSETESHHTDHYPDSIYLHKMESHLAFMEMEFKRNIEWQKQLLAELRKQKKGPLRVDKKNNSGVTLHLKQKEEEKLKEVLREYCAISNQRLSLSQLIKLASTLKEKTHVQRDKDVSFPRLPRVITLNDLAPSTQRNLDTVSPVKMAESKLKVPKYRHAAKTPHQLFSPESEEMKTSIKYKPSEPICFFRGEDRLMEDSLEKRLRELKDDNFITFREYLAESLRNRASQNVSLNLSSSRQEATPQEQTQKESLLLISDEEEIQQRPSIYLQLKLTKEAEKLEKGGNCEKVERMKKEQEILCFSAIKRRKIAKATQQNTQRPPLQFDDSRVRFKKLHDSFGKIYHEFEQARQEAGWKGRQIDQQTLQSDD